MFDDLYYEDNLRAARDLIARPPPAPKVSPAFSAWGMLARGPSKAGVAGVSQVVAFQSEVLGAFGQALDATGTASAQGMFSTQTDAERRQSEQQAQQIRTAGLNFSSTAGNDMRGFARFLAPDPETTHISERIVFDAVRVLTKGVGYVTTLGGLPGAILTGADEGMTTADDLKQQGVDLTTRTKVGAVVGGVTALGAALPVSGSTVRSTIALGATAGPLSFMAQQQVVRSMLQAADYSSLSEQYDPFDPVGLAVATLVPAGFGAWGLRASKARAAREAARLERAGTGDPVQTPPRDGAEVPAALREVTQEQVDAARLLLDSQHRLESSVISTSDWKGFDAHERALTQAMEQIARGERVSVTDSLPDMPGLADGYRITAQIEALQAQREALLPAAADLAERGAIRQAREELRLMEQQRPATSEADVRALAKTIQEQQGVGYRAALVEAQRQTAGAVADFEARQERLQGLIKSNARAQRATQQLGALDRQIRELQTQLGPEARLAAFHRATGRAVADLRPAAALMPDAALVGAVVDAPGSSPSLRAGAAGDAAAVKAPRGLVAEDHAQVAQRAELIRQQSPDLMVRLDGMDAPMPVGELLDRIKAEADDLLADGELMPMVAQCAAVNA